MNFKLLPLFLLTIFLTAVFTPPIYATGTKGYEENCIRDSECQEGLVCRGEATRIITDSACCYEGEEYDFREGVWGCHPEINRENQIEIIKDRKETDNLIRNYYTNPNVEYTIPTLSSEFKTFADIDKKYGFISDNGSKDYNDAGDVEGSFRNLKTEEIRTLYESIEDKDIDFISFQNSLESLSEEELEGESWFSNFFSNLCLSDNSCGLGKECSFFRCKKKDGFCFEESDCGFYETCNNTTLTCEDKINDCFELEIEGNQDSKEKINMVFVGDNYSSNVELIEEVENLIDWEGENGYNGLFSVEPFDDYRHLFKFYVVNSDEVEFEGKVGSNDFFPKGRINKNNFCEGMGFLGNKENEIYFSLISPKDFISAAYVHSNDFYVSTYIPPYQSIYTINDLGKVYLHEFGHSFAGLDDEYIYENNGYDDNFNKNCVDNITLGKENWGDLAEIYSEIDFYMGCSYNNSNYRSTKNSIMRNHWEEDDFGPVNERYLKNRLEELDK